MKFKLGRAVCVSSFGTYARPKIKFWMKKCPMHYQLVNYDLGAYPRRTFSAITFSSQTPLFVKELMKPFRWSNTKRRECEEI